MILYCFRSDCKFFVFFFLFFLWRRMLIAVIIHSIYHNVSTFYAGTHELFIHANPKIYIWYDENNNENVAKMRDKRKNRITGTHRILLDDLWFQTVYRTLRNVLRSIETRKFIKFHSTAISVKQNIIFLGLFCFILWSRHIRHHKSRLSFDCARATLWICERGSYGAGAVLCAHCSVFAWCITFTRWIIISNRVVRCRQMRKITNPSSRFSDGVKWLSDSVIFHRLQLHARYELRNFY